MAYQSSIITHPAPGVTLGCISPEASDLLNRIMDAYSDHYEQGQAIHKRQHWGPSPDDVYRFAYWLVRWSGLIQPAAIEETNHDGD